MADPKMSERLYKIRHSLAHVLAQAMEEKFPGVKLGFGPPTETGFFYDFEFPNTKVSEEDFKDLESRMRKIIGQRQAFSRAATDFDGAMTRLAGDVNSYKQENVSKLKTSGVAEFTFYSNGKFTDLCEGPHVENTGELPIKAFKLDRLAGAYWLGNEQNTMLTRVYALAFETAEQLQDFIKRREMALEFDHKKLGKELEIFHFDDAVGKGLPMWLPNGTIIRDEIEKLACEMEFKAGYVRVATPILAKEELFRRSGHLPAYEESMFPPIVCKHDNGPDEHFYLRPMNCPHHHLVFNSRMRSYRELPLRIAEYGTVFRYEQSGELSGLLRVRGMAINDAHIYARHDQIDQEVSSILELYKEMYAVFKLKDFSFRLSIRGTENAEKFVGSAQMWDEAEATLKRILDKMEIPYYVGEGEAAFYGPKIDIQFKNLQGREETVSTIQLDFLNAKRFNLTYIDENGQPAEPVIFHRAPLSTHERFISYILEYYGGALPTWVSPVQVCVIPITDVCIPYCKEFVAQLRSQLVRAEVDDSSNSLNKKIRTNTQRKIPILLIVGVNEAEQGTVTLRRYGERDQQTMSKAEFTALLTDEIRLRKNLRAPMASIF